MTSNRQCNGETKTGQRCKRIASQNSLLCAQHNKAAAQTLTEPPAQSVKAKHHDQTAHDMASFEQGMAQRIAARKESLKARWRFDQTMASLASAYSNAFESFSETFSPPDFTMSL